MSTYNRNIIYDNTIYNSQAGAVIFMCGLIFKITSMPGLIAKEMGSSTLWLLFIMTSIEFAIMVMTYLYFKSGGDQLLRENNSKIYRVVMFILMLYLSVKGLIYFTLMFLYLNGEMYDGVNPIVVISILLIPILYVGCKGVKSIARTCQILIIPMFIIIMLNLMFLKSDMDFGRNMPILNTDFGKFLIDGLKYGQWLGDMLPLLFIKLKQKKLPWIGISTGVVGAIVIVMAMLAVAMYGNALPLVDNFSVRIAGFNQFSMEIGRLDWIAFIVMATMDIMEISFIYWGVTECALRLFNHEKASCASHKISKLLYPLALAVISLTVPKAQAIIDLVKSPVAYSFTALAFAIPLILLMLKAAVKRKSKMNPKLLGGENLEKASQV